MMNLKPTIAVTLKYFFSILLLFTLAGLCQAQQEQNKVGADTVEREKMQLAYLPSALRIGPAVNTLIQTAIDDQGTYYGLQADLAMGRFMLGFDYGHAELSRQSETGVPASEAYQYTSKGDYYKIGVDVNLLRDKKADTYDARGDIIFFGLKYAFSIIDDEVSFSTPENFWETSAINQRNENLMVSWVEMNAGVKVAIFKHVFLGYTLRYRFAQNSAGRSSLVPYRVPGFGSGEDESNFGFDYHIFYQIPFRK